MVVDHNYRFSWSEVVSRSNDLTLIVGCCGLFASRGLGYMLHEKLLNPVPLNHVCLTLMANGHSLLMCAMAISDFAKNVAVFWIIWVFL